MKRIAWMLAAALAWGCGDDDSTADDGGTDTEPGDTAEETAEADVPAEADGAEEAEVPAPVALDLGESLDPAAGEDGAFEVELATPAGDEQFGIVLYSGLWAVGDPLTYAITSTGAAASRLGAAKSPIPSLRTPHRALELDAIREGLAAGLLRPARPDPMPPPTLGERRNYLIEDGGTTATIEAECVFVGEALAMWMDRTTAGAGDIDPADAEEIDQRFEDVVLPRERQYFGHESDINEDGVTNAVFSPIVYESATAYFSPCDLFDADALPLGCYASNEQEMLYMTPPEVIDPPMNSPRAIVATMAHEFQHLDYFYNKVVLNDLSGNENAYVMEGWASLGEDVTGYGLGTFFLSRETLMHSDEFGAVEILRSGAGYDRLRDGLLRGAAYLWTRYLFDRMGGDSVEADGTLIDEGGIAWTREAVASAFEGQRNVVETVGAPIDDVVFDWYTALLLTGRTDAAGAPLPVEDRFTYRPRVDDPATGFPRGFDPYGALFGMSLTGPVVVDLADADGSIPGTGNELLLAEADGTSPSLSFRVTAEATTALRVRVVRLR